MLKMKILPLGPLQTNCYVISDQNGSCVVIDCDSDRGTLSAYLKENNLHPSYVLLTHGHSDHTGSALKMKESFGLKIAVGELEEDVLKDAFENPEAYAEITGEIKPDVLLKDGETLTVGEMRFEVLHTPGHTKGSVCYVIEDILISGDTLFAGSCGRTDFFTGSFEDIVQSLKRLADLKGDYKVYPGHGPYTTLDYERKHNPFMR